MYRFEKAGSGVAALELVMQPTRGGRAEYIPSARRSLDLIRLMDVCIALAALIFLAPLMILAAACVRLQDGGPALFSHERIGRGGRTFKCLKFRSMVLNSSNRLAELLAKDPAARAEWERDRKLRRDPRITPLGVFLRKSSVDELPQLINILRGDMSLVGPRPIVDDEAAKYGRFFRYYAAVAPGLTGVWQASGRNDVDYRQRVAMDVLYVRRRSLAFNFLIILKTVPAVLFRSGSY